MKQYKQSNDYDVGLINGMVIPCIAFNIITGMFHVLMERDQLNELSTYYVVEQTLGITFTGVLFLISAALYVMVFLSKRNRFLIYLLIGGALNIFLNGYYAWVVIIAENGVSAGGWRYLMNMVIHLSIMAGGTISWRKIDREINTKKISQMK